MARFVLPIGIMLAFGATELHAQYTPPDPNGLEGIIVETYYVADGNDAADTDGSTGGLVEGAVTYRVFVDLREGYKLLTVAGYPEHSITFETSTNFFNNEDRGEAWGDAINDIHLNKNTVAIDSWLTAGAASDGHWGVLRSDDTDGSVVGGPLNNDGGSNSVIEGLLANDVPAMGSPLTDADGLLAGTPPGVTFVGVPPDLFNTGGSSYTSENFAWAVLGGVLSPEPSNKLLIGQFTTDGIFSFCLNIWVRIPDSLVCGDPNCHEILEFYGNLLPSDTAGTGFDTDNKFTLSSLCFNSSSLPVDCEGVAGGLAVPGAACDDGNPETSEDTYAASCDCLGEDCLGVPGGTALPGQPCDDGNPETGGDMWQTGCVCEGTVGIEEVNTSAIIVSLRPNPAKDLVWIELANVTGERTAYDVKNALGQSLLRMDLGVISGSWKGTIDLSTANSGVYFLEIVAGAEKHVERIVKF